MAVGVVAAGYVIVTPRGDETGEVLLGGVLVQHCLVDRQAQRVFQGQLQQGVIVPAHQHQVGAAVDLNPLVVTGQLLGAVVAAGQPGNTHLADAEGLHIAQVFLQHQSPQRKVLIFHIGQ